jgi:dipeptidyl aminopeptidase/acylaminoacyl peptidase
MIPTDMDAYQDIRAAKSPAVSPDGEVLAYLSDESGFHQVWMRPLAGGPARRVTDFAEPVGAIAFSPKSRDLVMTVDCGGDERHNLWLLPEGRDTPVPLTQDPDTVHVWGCWAPDGQRIAYSANSRDKAAMDVYVLDIATRTPTCVFSESGFREALAFTPDGLALVLRDSRRGTGDQDLFLLDLTSGDLAPLAPHAGRARYTATRMKKDGTGCFVVTDQGGDFLRLGLLSFSTRTVIPVAARPDCDIDTVAIHADSGRAAYVVNDRGWSRVFVRDLAGESETELTGLPPGVVGALAFTPDGRSLVVPHEGAATPADLWRLDPTAATPPERLTDAAKGGLDRSGFVEPAEVRIASFDGTTVPALVYRPAGAPPPGGWPAVVVVHGGPEAQWQPTFRADLQWLTANGVLVVAPNVRGSTGYGRPFHEADDRHRRMDAVADLKAVRDWLAARADVDAARLVVYGRSYGGFMVLAALTEYPDDWKLGVEFYGIANFETLLETTGPWRRKLRAAEYGDPDDGESDLLRRISPFHALDRVRAPLMIVHAGEDPRVPPGESEMVYSRLRGLGRPVRILRIPHEGHGFARAENRRTVFGAFAEFLAEQL